MNNSRTQRRLVNELMIQKAKTRSDWGKAVVLTSILIVVFTTTTITGFPQGSITPNVSPKPASSPAPTVDLAQPLTLSWRYESNLTLNLTPACDDERIYLPLSGGTLVSLMALSGQLNWRSEMGGELSASPVADRRAVYVASETGKPESGARRATGAL